MKQTNAPIQNENTENISYIPAIITLFLSFFLFGLSENIKGPALPRMQADFALREVQIGWLLALNSVAYLLACFYTSALARKIGLKLTNIISCVLMTGAGVMMFFAGNYPLLMAAYFTINLGNGMLEITLGIMAAKIFTKNTGTLLNLSHFFYGLSSIIAPLSATGLMKLKVGAQALDWGGMYLVMMALSLIPAGFALYARFPKTGGAEHSNSTSLLAYMKKPLAWMIIFVLSFAVVGEMSVGSWLVNFLEKSYGLDSITASGALTGFFVTFTLARLLLGPVIDRIGFVRSIILGSAFSAVTVILGVLLGKAGIFLLILSGVGIAIIYPTIMAVLAKVYADCIDSAMTITLTAMGMVTVLGNIAVGAIVEVLINAFSPSIGSTGGTALGYRIGYLFIGVCCLIAMLGAIALYRILKKRNELV